MLSSLTISVLSFASMVSASDWFQGFVYMEDPCFPVYEHGNCEKTLMEAYKSPFPSQSSNAPNTRFFLFTPSSQDKAEQLHQCGGLPPNSTFDRDCPTEIFIGGFLNAVCRNDWYMEMKEQLFQRSDCFNIILVDWSWGNTMDAFSAMLNVRVVGSQVAYVLAKIARQNNMDCRSFHAVGFSYGGYGLHYVGRFLKRRKCKIGRLTALDPAYRETSSSKGRDQLSYRDGHFVDVMHTNGGECQSMHYGDIRPLGHVDFYMNGGSYNPSCISKMFAGLVNAKFVENLPLMAPNICSHLVAVEFYKSSINGHVNDTQMIGVECKSLEEAQSGDCSHNCSDSDTQCTVVGMDTPVYYDTKDKKRRLYYVPTGFNCPYVNRNGFTGLPLVPKEASPPSGRDDSL